MKNAFLSLLSLFCFSALAQDLSGKDFIGLVIENKEMVVKIEGEKAQELYILLLRGGHENVIDKESGISFVQSDSVICSSRNNKELSCSMTLDISGALKPVYTNNCKRNDNSSIKGLSETAETLSEKLFVEPALIDDSELIKSDRMILRLKGDKAQALYILLLEGGFENVVDNESGISFVKSNSVICSARNNKELSCSMTIDKSGRLQKIY